MIPGNADNGLGRILQRGTYSIHVICTKSSDFVSSLRMLIHRDEWIVLRYNQRPVVDPTRGKRYIELILHRMCCKVEWGGLTGSRTSEVADWKLEVA